LTALDKLPFAWHTLSKEREGTQMKIKVKNNKYGRIKNDEVVKVSEYYLRQLIGDKVEGLPKIEITFKKLVSYRGGYVRTTRGCDIFKIAINSRNTLEEQLSTLAHECVHVKQYFLKELLAIFEIGNNGRAKWVKIWKGKRYIRKAYFKRPWEIEARKFQDKLALNVLNKIHQVAKPKAEVKAEVKPEIYGSLNIIEAKVLKVVELLNIENGNLVGQVLQGSTDKQYRIRVLKKVFDLKQRGILKEFNVNGIVWVGLAKNSGIIS
jgi:hypothetical protein